MDLRLFELMFHRNMSKKIYIVLSQTGTVLSRIIKMLTGAKYCHASISLSEDLSTMYSFGRIYPHNPFYGGYVKESPNYGTFKRFNKTRIVVLEFSVEDNTYTQMKTRLEEMYAHKDGYGYNYLGLVGAMFKRHRTRQNKFYCSEFVNHICSEYEIYTKGTLPATVRPIDFYKAFKHKVVFRGYLSNFCIT